MIKQKEGPTIVFCRWLFVRSIKITCVVSCSLLNQRLLSPFSHDPRSLYQQIILSFFLHPSICSTPVVVLVLNMIHRGGPTLSPNLAQKKFESKKESKKEKGTQHFLFFITIFFVPLFTFFFPPVRPIHVKPISKSNEKGNLVISCHPLLGPSGSLDST